MNTKRNLSTKNRVNWIFIRSCTSPVYIGNFGLNRNGHCLWTESEFERCNGGHGQSYSSMAIGGKQYGTETKTRRGKTLFISHHCEEYDVAFEFIAYVHMQTSL